MSHALFARVLVPRCPVVFAPCPVPWLVSSCVIALCHVARYAPAQNTLSIHLACTCSLSSRSCSVLIVGSQRPDRQKGQGAQHGGVFSAAGGEADDWHKRGDGEPDLHGDGAKRIQEHREKGRRPEECVFAFPRRFLHAFFLSRVAASHISCRSVDCALETSRFVRIVEGRRVFLKRFLERDSDSGSWRVVWRLCTVCLTDVPSPRAKTSSSDRWPGTGRRRATLWLEMPTGRSTTGSPSISSLARWTFTRETGGRAVVEQILWQDVKVPGKTFTRETGGRAVSRRVRSVRRVASKLTRFRGSMALESWPVASSQYCPRLSWCGDAFQKTRVDDLLFILFFTT